MSSLPNVQQNNEQILNDIQTLQSMEQDLFNSLETNPNLTSQQQQQIISKINDISTMRVNLYQTLSGVNGFFQGALNTSIDTLQEQTAAIGIVESELNQAKIRLQALEDEQNNKLRLVEINNYYGDKYTEHAKLMKIVIFILIPVIILTVLNNRGLLPRPVFYGLICIIAIIGGYFFWITMASILTRDNMNYNEYNWYFDPATAPTGSSNSTDPWASSTTSGACVGAACCSSNQMYDVSSNLCIDVSYSATNLPATTGASGFTTYGGSLFSNTESFKNNNTNGPLTESMVNSVLTKTSGNYKSQYTIDGNSKIKPYGGQSFVNFR
jgi:hypothetical protein